MSIITKTGDTGETGLLGGSRVPKDDPRISACGEIDELNSAIGILLVSGKIGKEIIKSLGSIQKTCFVIGAELATSSSVSDKLQSYLPVIVEQDISSLEAQINAWEANLPLQNKFILPTGTPEAALCFWIRAVARRAERTVVTLDKINAISPLTLKYLNRVSDYFFILGRWLNQQAGIKETEWNNGSKNSENIQ